MSQDVDAEDASYNEDYGEPIFKQDNVLSSEFEDGTNSEDNDDSDEDNEKAIYEAVTACLELFSRFTGRADSSDTSTKPEDIVDKRPTERVEFIGDMEGSFNLWIDYTGALAADVNRSLDVRLQRYTDIKGMSVELLQMLARNLEYLEKGDEGGSNSLRSSELQKEAVNSIREAVEELHFMASVIRRSSVRSQNYSLSSEFESDDDPYFENYVFLILRHTFPHARRSLCKQLGASIALRRKRLRRKIQHEEKLKTRRTPNQVNISPEQATPVAQSQPSRPQPGLPRQVETHVIPTSSIDTRSNLDPGMARRRLKAGPALSTISMGSSVCLSGRKYPPKPYFRPEARDCACPYCAQRLSTVKLGNIPTFWDDHLDEDVQPYICLSEECTSPLLFFVHMKQWVDHMNSVHSEQWTRIIHMSTWYCDTNHEAEQFNDLESFREHMKDPANHPGRPPPSDLQLDTLSRNKQKALTREDEYSCPFCDCIPDALKPVIPTSEPNVIRHQLHKHIASHIKSLAVLSIPVLTTTETPEFESDESEVEEKDRRLKKGEEASYPSGYDEELRALRLSDDENPDPEEMPSLDVFETQNTHWHDVGFIEWYKSEEARANTSGLENDVVLQDFIRVQDGGGVGPVSNLVFLPNEDYTVGWICAINTEYVAAQAFLDEKHEGPASVSTYDNNVYTLGKIGKHNVVIAVLPHGEYGTSSAASVARDMLHSFPNVRIGLMVGIGGGAPSRKHDIRLGDVVVSASGNGEGGVLQYDFGKAIQDQDFQQTGFLNQPPTILRAAVNGLMAQYEVEGHQLEESINSIFEKKPRLWKKYRRPELSTDRLYQPGVLHMPDDESSCATACGNDPSTLVVRPERAEDEDNPLIHYGLIASANILMKDALIRDTLAKKNDVLCFEMEAAGLMNHFPCLVIRGICDYSDTHKNKEWQGYAAMTAAAYAKDLLCHLPPNKDTTKLIQDDHLNKIKNWLAPPDPSINLNYSQSLHYRGTGQWFLESKAYSRWKKEKNSFLWLSGTPGCGKTILSSTIITDLDPTNSNPKVLYFFFDLNDIERISLEKAIRSLIFQLYSKHIILRTEVDAVYSSFGDGTRQPDALSLDELLRYMLTKADEIYIVLDALDECERHSGSRSSKSLLDWIKGVHDKSTNTHILITSRPEHDIRASFSSWAHTNEIIQLQSGLVSDDIAAYTKARVSEMPRWKGRPDIQAEIETTLLEKADGMFRWVSCQFDRLEQCLDPPSVRRELQNLPKTLDATYAQSLQRIHPNHLSTAKRLLQFLTYSERPLKLKEAVDLIAVDPSSQPAFTPENRMPIPEDIIIYCSSLVVLVHKNVQSNQLDTDTVEQVTEIQLAHFSVKEYLLSDRLEPYLAQELNEISAKASIVDVCLSYLLAIHKLCSPEEARKQYYLAEFSAQYWMKNAKDVESSYKAIIPSVKEYFLCPHAFQFGCQLEHPHGLKRIHALYHASLWGLLYSSIFLLQNGADINAQGGEYGNALQAASAQGHSDIAEMLIQKGADINAQGGRCGTALQAASSEGHLEIAQTLIEKGADINAEGHLEITQMLIERGANINAQHGQYSTALQAASSEGHLEIAQMLIEKGADVNAQHGRYGTALQAASAGGHLEIARVLIEKGADVNARGGEDGRYGNALHAASAYGHLEIAELLIQKGADINAKGGHYGDALQAASERGHLEIARLLIQEGAKRKGRLSDQ